MKLHLPTTVKLGGKPPGPCYYTITKLCKHDMKLHLSITVKPGGKPPGPGGPGGPMGGMAMGGPMPGGPPSLMGPHGPMPPMMQGNIKQIIKLKNSYIYILIIEIY